jgi:hypothetical protein
MNAPQRTIVVGKNSKVWQNLSDDPRLAGCLAIGHAEVAGFAFHPSDRVWILSFSRDMDDNQRLFETLSAAGAKDCIYVSTATANVDAVTRCYEYPRVKRASEALSQSLLGARVVLIGVVYQDLADLPAGITMATNLDQLAEAIANLAWSGTGHVNLFAPVQRPFTSGAERLAFVVYGIMQRLAAAWPCLLRPLDIILRALGWRWYGYLYLSNRLWLTTTS